MNNNKRTRLLGSAPIIPAVCADEGRPGLVSVLIPTYNRGYIISQTIDSVLAQTYSNIEIIVVDDGSTDNTREVLARYGSKLRYIHQSNAGLAPARNTGLEAARGEFIAFLDSDDIWLPWKIEAQVAVMRQVPEAALAWTDMTAIDPRGEIVQHSYLTTYYSVYGKLDATEFMHRSATFAEVLPSCPQEFRDVRFRHGDIYSAMAIGNLVHPPTVLLRRSCVRKTGGLDVTFTWTCEDYEFFWRVLQHGPGILIEAPAMLYRINGADQLTRPELGVINALGNMVALNRHLKEYGARIRLPGGMIRRHISDSLLWLGRERLFSPDSKRMDAIRNLAHSLLRNPLQKQAFLLLLVGLSMPRSLFPFFRSIKKRAIRLLPLQRSTAA